jgi:hypothetical protein
VADVGGAGPLTGSHASAGPPRRGTRSTRRRRLTPPKISGDVIIPSRGVKLGPHVVTATYTASVESLPPPIGASAPISVVKG